MTGNAGALLDTGEDPTIACSRGATATWILAAAQAAPHTMHYGAQTRLLRSARNDSLTLISGVLLHHLENRCGTARCRVIFAPSSALHLNHLLLQGVGLLSISLLPQDRGEIAHCRQTIGVLLAEFAAGGREHRYEQLPRAGEVALRGDRSGKVVDGPQGFEIGVAEQRATPAYHLLLQLPRLFQMTLRCQGHRQFSDRLQRVRVLLSEEPAAPFDDPFFELPRRDQPPLRPQAVGEVEHGGERLGVIFSERSALFVQLPFLGSRSCFGTSACPLSRS